MFFPFKRILTNSFSASLHTLITKINHSREKGEALLGRPRPASPVALADGSLLLEDVIGSLFLFLMRPEGLHGATASALIF